MRTGVEPRRLLALQIPFPAKDIEWKVQRDGKSGQGKVWAMVVAYVTNRAIQERLDLVCGPENWSHRYEYRTEGIQGKEKLLFTSTISILIDGKWTEKSDGSEESDYESYKGGISGAMKRAGSMWGIGRYLYNLEENFAKITEDRNGKRGSLKERNGQRTDYRWFPPALPEWSLPSKEQLAILKQLKEESIDQLKRSLGDYQSPIPTPQKDDIPF